MTTTILLIAIIPFLIICYLSVKGTHHKQISQKHIFSIFIATCIPLMLMLWMGFYTLKQTIPPYLEIVQYEMTDQEFFMGKHPKKCQLILTDPAADDVHALLSKEKDQWTIQNLSSYRRIQVGHNYEEVHSVELKQGDTFTINNRKFLVQQQTSVNFLGWHKITVVPQTKHMHKNIPITATSLFHNPIKIGPKSSDNWISSPVIPVSEIGNQKAAAIIFKDGRMYLKYAKTSGKRRYQVFHNGVLLSRNKKVIDSVNGTTICLGRTCYRIKAADPLKDQRMIVQPLTHRPRIYLKNITQTHLVLMGDRPFAQAVMDIPFSLDQPTQLSMDKQHVLTIGHQNSYRAGERIYLKNESGNGLVLRYVDPIHMSIVSFDQTPIPGSLHVILSILLMILLFSMNALTQPLHMKTLFLYYFLLLMSVTGALIACRMGAFAPKHAQWAIDYSSYLILSSIVFLVLTNLKWLRWPLLRLEHSVYKVQQLIHKPIDFHGFFSKQLGRIWNIDFYPSTCIGLVVIILFLVQLGFGSELGIALPFLGLFQPVFLCEILIVLVIAFWTQRNIEADQKRMGESLTDKNYFFVLMNRDLLVFSSCFVVLPLYVLRDFSPFLIFSTIILVSFSIRPTIHIRLRYLLLCITIILAFLMIIFPDYLGHTLASRIQVWKNPWIKTEKGFQFIQNLWLLKGIGFWGNGLGGTDISIHFPALHRDFMVSLFMGDFGVSGLILLMLTWTAFLLTLFYHSQVHFSLQNENKQFIQMIVFWMAFLLMLHTWFIIGSNLGLFPVMGIPLPFLASGFNCLLFLGFIGVGLCTLCIDHLYSPSK